MKQIQNSPSFWPQLIPRLPKQVAHSPLMLFLCLNSLPSLPVQPWRQGSKAGPSCSDVANALLLCSLNFDQTSPALTAMWGHPLAQLLTPTPGKCCLRNYFLPSFGIRVTPASTREALGAMRCQVFIGALFLLQPLGDREGREILRFGLVLESYKPTSSARVGVEDHL